MHQSRFTTFAMLLMTALAGHAASAPKPAAEGRRIQIRDFMYQPMSLTVTAGTTVTWVNKDDEPHTIISTTGLFRSSGIDTNETFAFRFDKPGRYDVYCSLHPRMVGTIIVE